MSGTEDEVKTAKDGIISSIDFSSFSNIGNQEFKKSIGEYIDSLYEESTKKGQLHGANQVSDNDVKIATKFLFSSPQKSKNKDYLTILGSTLFGSSVALMTELPIGAIPFNAISVLITFGTLASGLIILFIGLKD